MSETFDPYRKWLGIPPEEQPPHYYRLLGLVPFEADPEVITTAADGRMALLKRFQSGRYAAISQQLLNQIATAKVCLLNAEKRSAYDAQLRVRLGDEKKPPKAEPAARKPAADAARPELPAIKVDIAPGPAASLKTRPNGNVRAAGGRRWQLPTLAGALGLLIIVIIITATTRNNGSDATTPSDNGTKVAAASNNGAKKPVQDPTTKPNEKPANEQPKSPNDQVAPPVPFRPFELPVDPPTTGDPTTPAKPVDPAKPVEPTKPAEPVKPAAAPQEPAMPAKPPVPEGAEQKAAEEEIRKVFAREFGDAARATEAKLRLAGTLIEQSRQADINPVQRYVLLRTAADLRVQAGEIDAALELSSAVAASFEINPLTFQCDILDAVLRAPRGISPELGKSLYQAAMALFDSAVVAADFDVCERAAKVADTAARKAKDGVGERVAGVRSNEVRKLRAQHAEAERAKATLSTTPDDAEANYRLGVWEAFVRGQWKTGLPYLAKGRDRSFADLAKRELQSAQAPEDQVSLADAWFEIAKKETRIARGAILNHCEELCYDALPKLKGLDKRKAEKRLGEIAEQQGQGKPINHALAANGAKVTGTADRIATINDGITEYKPGAGYAVAPCPWEFTITLDRVYTLRQIRVLLYDKENRGRPGYRFRVFLSEDGKSSQLVGDYSQADVLGWQNIDFRPQRAKFINFQGLPDPRSSNSYFHLVELEAYSNPPPAAANK